MAKRGEDRREKILSVAEASILQKGFNATSIDDILQQAHITKGGFFYHFPDKNHLARALVERYLESDELFFQTLIDRAKTLTEDPLQQMLLFLALLAEAMEQLEDVHPGCLVASFTYENQQFDDELRALMREGMLRWRQQFLTLLNPVYRQYPPQIDVSLDAVADALSTILEGGIILSRVLSDKLSLVNQIHQYRTYIRLLFSS